MKQAFLQFDGKSLVPVSQENLDVLKSYKPNQILRCEIYGTRKQRSVLQNRYIHAVFRITASNTSDIEWDTPEKVKLNVKMAMKFFNAVIVQGNKVWFELRSFAFDEMEQAEADIRYSEAILICAKKLGVEPSTLEARAKEEG